jgi:ppGpp synthetase/RelA/SpoT-type nucleotidyltranferase
MEKDIIDKIIQEKYELRDKLMAKKAIEKLVSDLYALDDKYYEQFNETIITNIDRRLKTRTSVNKKILKKINKFHSDDVFSSEIANEIYDHIKDIAGVRFCCPYSDEIIDIIKFVKENLEKLDYMVDWEDDEYKDKNFLETGNELGYRFYHFYVKVPIQIDIFGHIDLYICEVQVRSEIQNVWAIKSHKLIYNPLKKNVERTDIEEKWKKENKTYNKCKEIMKFQSDLLNTIDKQFCQIRDLIYTETKQWRIKNEKKK